MPILHNSRPLFRIKFKDANIREVRRGNELEWGLYFIEYNKGIPVEVEDENISEYVWGYPGYIKEDFELYLPEGDDEYGGFYAKDIGILLGTENAYRSKAVGWYDNRSCVDNPQEELHYIPAITRDFHKDLKLFCKWKQRQYRYKGVIKNDRYYWEEGGGGGGGNFSPITNTTPRYGVYSGECTTWCVYRSKEAFGEACISSYGNASTWMNSGTLGANWERKWDSNVVPGDIVVLTDGGAGHVLFVETSSIITQSNVWQPDGTGAGSWYAMWSKDMSYDTFHSPGHKYFSCVVRNSFDGYLGMSYLGRLHYTGEGGGGGGGEGDWAFESIESYSQDDHGNPIICAESDSGTFAWDSGTQDWPRAPQRYDQEAEDAEPGEHWRKDQRWDPIECYTYSRYLTYNENGEIVFSEWSLEDSGSSTGTNIPGWETEDSGPLPGWLIDWE